MNFEWLLCAVLLLWTCKKLKINIRNLQHLGRLEFNFVQTRIHRILVSSLLSFRALLSSLPTTPKGRVALSLLVITPPSHTAVPAHNKQPEHQAFGYSTLSF